MSGCVHFSRLFRILGACALLPGCATLLEPMPRSEYAPVVLASATAQAPLPPPAPVKKIEVPSGLPGSEATLPSLPPETPETRDQRLKAIDALFPNLPDLGPDPVPAPSADGLGVEALVEQAKQNNPLIQQAMAEIDRNRGLWVQAGLYPNPTIGAQLDQIGDFGPYGQFGGYFTQNVVTGGKLRIARGVAYFDLINARLQLRRQELDLAKQVRSDYYAVLVAAENVRLTRLITQFADSLYSFQVGSVRGGQSPPHDASASRSMAVQARTALFQARNRYTSAWKQLAATLNAPDLPPAALAGRVEEAIPRYTFESLQERMLAGHTDLEIARNELAQAQQALLLEQKRIIPDVQNYLYMQRDTLALSQRAPSFQVGMQVGVTVPIFNKNQGAIAAATATVAAKARQVEKVRNDLTRNLADSFERYENGRQQIALYRDLILPDLVRAFRGTFDRFQVEPDKLSYGDISSAQQNLMSQITSYLQALSAQWQAVADLTAAVQSDDPYTLSEGLDPAMSFDWIDGPKRIPERR